MLSSLVDTPVDSAALRVSMGPSGFSWTGHRYECCLDLFAGSMMMFDDDDDDNDEGGGS